MTVPKIRRIGFRRGSTEVTVYPYELVTHGVHLYEGQVEGIYDAPIKSTWKTGAFQDGSRQKAYKKLHRDMELGFGILETITTSYEFNDSVFRQLFDYELDQWEAVPTKTIMDIETDLSGTRSLDVLMYEQPEFSPAHDPIQDQFGNAILKLRAGQPMWYEDDVITSFTSASGSASGTVTVTNPTNQIMRHKWICTPATWTLPDFQWVGDRGVRTPGGTYGTRTVGGLTVSSLNGGMVVDLDRQKLMFRDANDTNIIAQFAGTIFNHAIPPYTPPTALPVSYTGAPAGGAMVQLVQPRLWGRPYGGELAI
jgi:hypothetical protein